MSNYKLAIYVLDVQSPIANNQPASLHRRIIGSKSHGVSLKAQQSLPGQRVNGEGLWLNSLDYLPVCYTHHSMLTVLYVVCYQSVTRILNNSSGYVYNRELITQPTPISHSPGKFKFWIWRLDFFLKLIFLVVLSKKKSEYNLRSLHSRCLQSFNYKSFVNISLFW